LKSNLSKILPANCKFIRDIGLPKIWQNSNWSTWSLA